MPLVSVGSLNSHNSHVFWECISYVGLVRLPFETFEQLKTALRAFGKSHFTGEGQCVSAT